MLHPERWQSGRLRYLGKVVTGQLVPGFESPSLRHIFYLEEVNISVNIKPMSIKYIQKLASILDMLENINQDLDLVGYNETEKKIFYTIVNNIHNNKKCNITDVIQVSGFSRSTVYKAIKEFENQGLVSLIQSDEDRREVFLDLGIA
tara:strand:+ start:8046 stop:8486 length:441 start_codon:yes stop_codon:yes gene_type:complete